MGSAFSLSTERVGVRPRKGFTHLNRQLCGFTFTALLFPCSRSFEQTRSHTGVVILQPRAIELLPGKLVIGDHRARVALFTIRAVLLVRSLVAAGVGLQYCTPQMVRMQVGEGAALLHAGTPWVAHPREEVVLGDGREPLGRGNLIVGEGVETDGTPDCLLHPLRVPFGRWVVEVCFGRAAGDLSGSPLGAILYIPNQALTGSTSPSVAVTTGAAYP